MHGSDYDVIVVGAGVVGSFIARALSRYALRILLVDQAADVGDGTTKANTAIVHAGYDAKPGSLKARLSVAGNAMFDRLAAHLDFDFDRCGTYVVATNEQDLHTLHSLCQRGQENGVPGLAILSGEEMRRREPAVTPNTVGALLAPTGGIVDPFGLCVAAAESAVLNGVELRLETRVVDLLHSGQRITGVATTRGEFRGQWVIVAAGLWSDDLVRCAARCTSVPMPDLTIAPRKGEYLVLDRVAAEQVHSVLFPCPTAISKGILVTRTIHGNVMVGPNALDCLSKEDLSTTAEGLNEVMAGAQKLVPTLDPHLVIRTFAGLRASGAGSGYRSGDFYIQTPPGLQGLLVLAGIESPGLTASPAIAGHVVEMLGQVGLPLCERSNYRPTRTGMPRFARLSRPEQQALIARDPRFGRVVCRCESVTEGEIAAACHGPIPATTYDAIKRRTRLGTGRCQGSFDTPLAIGIMARELGIPILQVNQKGPGSPMLSRETKEVTTADGAADG